VSRLAPLDKVLVLILVPFWVFSFILAAGLQVQGRGNALLGLSVADAESYPALTGQFAVQHRSDPLEAAGIQVLWRGSPCFRRTV
jgi:hypothetical protein